MKNTKIPSKTLLFFVWLVLFTTHNSLAQQSQDLDVISQLKEQIKQLEAIEVDLATLPKVREINKRNLQHRRLQLNALLRQEIEALQSYQSQVKFLTPDEKKDVSAQIKRLEDELHSEKALPFVQNDHDSPQAALGHSPFSLSVSKPLVTSETSNSLRATVNSRGSESHSIPPATPEPPVLPGSTTPKPPSGSNQPDLSLRAVLGFEQVGASASNNLQKLFVNLFFSTPLSYDSRMGVWGDVRVTSIPQQVKSVSSFAGDLAGAFASQFKDIKTNEISQAVEFLVGTEVRLSAFQKINPQDSGCTDNNKTTPCPRKFLLSFLVGGGATTPLTPRDTVEVFKVPTRRDGKTPKPSFIARFPEAKGKEFIAFLTEGRDRFFRQYYGGLRLRTFYQDRLPAILDVTFGQNEAVTGGQFRGGVFRLDGFYPLPFRKAEGAIYIFGTAFLKLSRNKTTDPLFLEPAPSNTPVPSPNVGVKPIPQADRDYYRIGVGFDLKKLFQL